MPLPPVSRARCWFLPLATAAALLVPAAAHAGTHTTLAAFQQNVRADVLLEPFDGASGPVPGLQVSGNGYLYSVMGHLGGNPARNGFGIGAQNSGQSTLFTFTGKPVTAFGGTLRRMDSNNVSIGGEMTIVTDTGESFAVTAAVGGTFFGFTTTQPFSTVTYNTSVAGQGFEFIDDVYVGTSGTAVIAADQCADAVTVSPITAVQYPFTTVGATAEAITGSCASTDTGPDVWFRFLSPVYGNVTINTCGCTFDSVLRVFSSCPPAAGTGEITCNDDFCLNTIGNNHASQVSFRAEAGEDYLIRISGFNGASGSGNLFFSVVHDCLGDFNHTGGPATVQDIFDFLSAYFGGCP